MKVFKKSNKIQKAHKVYKDHKWSIGLSVFLLGAVFFIGTVNHASALGANITPDQAEFQDIRIPSSPSQLNFASFSQADPINCPHVQTGNGFGLDILDSLVEMTGGLNSTDILCLEEQGYDSEAILNVHQQYRGLGDYTNLATIVLLDQKPASGRSYIEEKVYALSHLGQVSAQDVAPNVPYYYPGTGYSLLSPIQDFWGWSVNIVYGFLIILIVIVAFGIMFRSKLGGSAAITLQSAIPSIAMAMVLVPLSYAISGLAIDFITLGTNVTHEFIMGPGAPARNVYTQRPPYFVDGEYNDNAKSKYDIKVPLFDNKNSGIEIEDRGYYADDTRVTWYSAWNNVNVSEPTETLLGNSAVFDNGVMDAINYVVKGLSAINSLKFSVTGGFEIDEDSGGTVQAWIGDIINLVVQLLLFLTGLRVFWKLLKKFGVLLVSPIFSPFIFATIAIPGSGLKNVMNYGKSLYVAAMFYIIAYTMFLISLVFSSHAFQSSLPDFANSGYVPPLLGIESILNLVSNNSNQIAGQGTTAFVLSLVAVIVYLQIPKVLDDFDKKMGTDKNALGPMLSSTLESARHSIATPGVIGGRVAGTVAATRAGIGAVGGSYGAMRDAYDRARGRAPGEEGSWRYRVRQDSAQRKAELYKRSQSATGASKLGYQARMAASNLASRAGGSNLQGAENPNEKVEISTTLKWYGDGRPEIVGGGFIKLTRNWMLEQIQQVLDHPAYNPADPAAPIPQLQPIRGAITVDIEAKNTTLPRVLDDRSVTIFSFDDSDRFASSTPDVQRARRRSATQSKGSADTTLPFRSGIDLFGLNRAAGGSMSVTLSADQYFTESNGKTATISFDLNIVNAFALFGYDRVTRRINLNNSIFYKGVRGPKIILSFGPNKDAKEFRISFQVRDVV